MNESHLRRDLLTSIMAMIMVKKSIMKKKKLVNIPKTWHADEWS
jgi:hypothetical protein